MGMGFFALIFATICGGLCHIWQAPDAVTSSVWFVGLAITFVIFVLDAA